MFFFYDYYYIILVIPAIIISMYAQFKVQSTYKKYSEVMSKKGLTAHDVTRKILDLSGLKNVKIEHIAGKLSDHYDPRTNVIRLSDSVYSDTSVASLGVAAHEAGHAIQHATGYFPIKLRNSVLPVANIGSRLSVPLIILGIILSFEPLISFGILLFSFVLLFQLITLPVEFNASRRALSILNDTNMLDESELIGSKKVLSAAAMTYVAAALVSATQLLRLLLISRNRNR